MNKRHEAEKPPSLTSGKHQGNRMGSTPGATNPKNNKSNKQTLTSREANSILRSREARQSSNTTIQAPPLESMSYGLK